MAREWGVWKHPWEDLENVGQERGEGAKAKAGPGKTPHKRWVKLLSLKIQIFSLLLMKPDCLRAACAAAMVCSSLFSANAHREGSPCWKPGRFPISTNWGQLLGVFSVQTHLPWGTARDHPLSLHKPAKNIKLMETNLNHCQPTLDLNHPLKGETLMWANLSNHCCNIRKKLW